MRQQANITPEQFRDAFESATRDQADVLLKCWSSQPAFTKYITTQLIPRVAQILQSHVETEHQRIDFVLRQGSHPLVAIEHENNFPGTAESELRKLKSFDASLGVLITYVGRQQGRMIREYNAEMAIGRITDDCPLCANILLIIGPYGMRAPKKLEWKYFAFDGREFRAL